MESLFTRYINVIKMDAKIQGSVDPKSDLMEKQKKLIKLRLYKNGQECTSEVAHQAKHNSIRFSQI